jgi:Zn-dependent M28 family amino/carboxypeptidase
LYPFGKTRDVSVTGAERTTLWPLVERDAKRSGLEITPDPEPEQGHYYRSDHFSLARVGIPAFSISQGTNYLGKPANFGSTVFEEYNTKHYHQPSDEYHDDWDFAGMEQMADFGLTLGLDIANLPKLSTKDLINPASLGESAESTCGEICLMTNLSKANLQKGTRFDEKSGGGSLS